MKFWVFMHRYEIYPFSERGDFRMVRADLPSVGDKIFMAMTTFDDKVVSGGKETFHPYKIF